MVGRPSSRLSLARLLVHCCSVTGLSLVCHWSVCSTHLSLMLGSACLCITDPSARAVVVRLSARVVIAGLPLVYHWSTTGLPLVFLLESWSLVRVADRASLVCLFLFLLVCHWSVTGLSLLVGLVCCSSVVGHGRRSACCSACCSAADASLVCLFVHH